MNSQFVTVIEQLKERLAWLPSGVAAAIILALLCLAALGLQGFMLRWLRKARFARSKAAQGLIARAAAPTRVATVLLVVIAGLPAVRLAPNLAGAILSFLVAALVVTVGWGAVTGVGLASDLYLERFSEGLGENVIARRHVTQVRVLRRAAQALIILITLAAVLMAIPGARQYGVSVFASAGAAGIIVGFAARPILSNLLAGLQIAITQPVKVEDAVVINGEWGWVEDITTTYIVVRIWDWRRLVVPLSWFLEQPFQNWTRESSSLIGSVHIWADYTVPIESLRQELERIVHASALWDGNVVVLQVIDTTADAIQIRALASARNSGQAWDLRCEIREKMVRYLQTHHPNALPHHRLRFAEGGETEETAPVVDNTVPG